MKGETIQEKYEVIKVLGQDSLTQTFLARGKGLNSFQRYAIKKFRPILGNPQGREIKDLFDREAKILQLLSQKSDCGCEASPNKSNSFRRMYSAGRKHRIPRLYEYFTEGEEFYLVREWIEGITLEQKVQQQGKLAETEVKQILSSILSLLKYIHNYGIIYRELSPSSIVLRNCDLKEEALNCFPVPIYFSGVKELETENQPLNQGSLVLANRQEYVFPEQEQYSFASDLYSLGLTAIYLLTSKTPAELDCDLYSHRLLWHQETSEVTTNLILVIDRAISPNIQDRFTSAEEMLQALFPQSINISESLITKTETKSRLTPELKIISTLSCLSLGFMGIAFATLNFDFDRLTKGKSDRDLLTDKKTQVLSSSLSDSLDSLRKPMLNIPAFRVDTPQEVVVSSLGQPTHESRGYWDNSRAFLYQDFIPEQVDLGYLSHVETKIILQTEVSFAESVSSLEVENLLGQLLMVDYSTEIEKKIDLVISKESDKQEFSVNDLQGVIQRNAQNRIYVAVWKSGFHQ